MCLVFTCLFRCFLSYAWEPTEHWSYPSDISTLVPLYKARKDTSEYQNSGDFQTRQGIPKMSSSPEIWRFFDNRANKTTWNNSLWTTLTLVIFFTSFFSNISTKEDKSNIQRRIDGQESPAVFSRDQSEGDSEPVRNVLRIPPIDVWYVAPKQKFLAMPLPSTNIKANQSNKQRKLQITRIHFRFTRNLLKEHAFNRNGQPTSDSEVVTLTYTVKYV